MIDMLASALVVLVGVYFVALAAASLFAPARTTGFLHGFAGSAPAHYLELLLRLVAGGAFVLHAPSMLFPGLFLAFGWILLVTTAGLLAVPWQWHHRFAVQSVPYAVRHLRLFAVASFALGAFVLSAVGSGAS